MPDVFNIGPFTLIPPDVRGPIGYSTNRWTIALQADEGSLIDQVVAEFSLAHTTMRLTGAVGLGIIVNWEKIGDAP